MASGSPRRSALLRDAGYEFEILPSDVSEEHDPGLSAEEAACLLAERKARATAALLAEAARKGDDPKSREPVLLIGSDTIVALGEGATERLLGKPADEAEAADMLRSLSASRHRVVTGVCVLRCLSLFPEGPTLSPEGPIPAPEGEAPSAYVAVERTYVTMREISAEEVQGYVASMEWQGKAGGYAIQENADAFVTALEEGGFDNVVGLPVALTRRLLAEAARPSPHSAP